MNLLIDLKLKLIILKNEYNTTLNDHDPGH
jgi:hypothetical protein